VKNAERATRGRRQREKLAGIAGALLLAAAIPLPLVASDEAARAGRAPGHSDAPWGAQAMSEEVERVSDTTLIDFGSDFDVKNVEMHGRNVTVRLVDADGDGALHVGLPPDAEAGVSLRAPEGAWDLSDRVAVACDVTNVGSDPIALRGNLNGKSWIDGFVVLEPRQTDSLEIILKRAKRDPALFGLPGGHVALWEEADPARISHITIAPVDATDAGSIEIRNVRAVGQYTKPPEGGVDGALTPFVDQYGQYKHREWPDKTHSDEDLEAQKKREEADLHAHPGPEDWNRYGGWAAGPNLEATGHFRVEKYDGKWWFVDP
jgi:hypothetical protein